MTNKDDKRIDERLRRFENLPVRRAPAGLRGRVRRAIEGEAPETKTVSWPWMAPLLLPLAAAVALFLWMPGTPQAPVSPPTTGGGTIAHNGFIGPPQAPAYVERAMDAVSKPYESEVAALRSDVMRVLGHIARTASMGTLGADEPAGPVDAPATNGEPEGASSSLEPAPEPVSPPA